MITEECSYIIPYGVSGRHQQVPRWLYPCVICSLQPYLNYMRVRFVQYLHISLEEIENCSCMWIYLQNRIIHVAYQNGRMILCNIHGLLKMQSCLCDCFNDILLWKINMDSFAFLSCWYSTSVYWREFDDLSKHLMTEQIPNENKTCGTMSFSKHTV